MTSSRFLRVLLLTSAAGLVGCGGGDDGGGVDAGPDAGPSPDYTTGAACASDAECGANGTGQCLVGFELLSIAPAPTVDDPLAMAGLGFPGGYCSNVDACASDADCGAGGACFRPLDGATDTAGLHSSTVTQLGDVGICLESCTADSDCRQAEGYRCQVPLQADLQSVSDRSTDTYCILDEVPPCAITPAAVPTGKCHLRYDLTGSFQITDTAGGQGDGIRVIGPGTLIVEVDSNVAGDAPSTADGSVDFLCYHMRQRMEVASVITSVEALATDTTPVATGAFSGDTIDMQGDCTYAGTYGIDRTMWSPASTTATGTSCLSNYTSLGDVYCPLGMIGCSIGGLLDGHNLQDDTWTQPLNDVVLTNGAGDFSAIEMAGQGNPDRWTPLAICNGLGLEEPDSGGMYGVTCADTGTWVDSAGTAVDVGNGSDPNYACYFNYCNLPDDKVEIPNANPSRTFLGFTGDLAETVCVAP